MIFCLIDPKSGDVTLLIRIIPVASDNEANRTIGIYTLFIGNICWNLSVRVVDQDRVFDHEKLYRGHLLCNSKNSLSFYVGADIK